MAQMKYIRYEDLGVVLFESHISHKNMHEVVSSPMDKLMSAGTTAFWALGDDLEVQASGGSTTLNVPSLKDDADLIKRRLSLY